MDEARIYPASHYVTPADQLERALTSIHEELRERLAFFRARGRLLEAQRLEQRTLFDVEMLREIGYCHGIENYSRHLVGPQARTEPGHADGLPAARTPGHHRRVARDGAADPRDVRGRSLPEGDAGRVRLPAAVGVRQPAAHLRGVHGASCGQVLYVSATPGPLRAGARGRLARAAPGQPHAGGAVAEQIIRPTGLMDPRITVRPATVAGRRPHGRGAGARGARRAGAHHHPDQAHGRGPDRVLPAERAARALPALGHRHARAGGADPRPAARQVRRPRRHQSPARGARPARRCRWWPSSTRTRRATCGRPPR